MSDSAVSFYLSRIVSHARTMPVSDAVLFLGGALEIAGGREEMMEIRRAHQALVIADDQLELLAGPQLRLNLNPEARG